MTQQGRNMWECVTIDDKALFVHLLVISVFVIIHHSSCHLMLHLLSFSLNLIKDHTMTSYNEGVAVKLHSLRTWVLDGSEVSVTLRLLYPVIHWLGRKAVVDAEGMKSR
jgi:hypothetical protein